MVKDQKPSSPKEAQVMTAILKDMGITDFEPGVLNQMLEFTYRYVSQILDDSRVYANYAKKGKSIEIDDVKLAIQMQVDKSFTSPPPRDLLLELARVRNANPLPAIKPQCGIRLPPDRYCLSACNYKLRSTRKKVSNLQSSRMGINTGGKLGGTTLKPALSMVTTKAGNTSTVTLVQKPANPISSGPTQKIVSVNRPVIKVTPGPPGGITPKFQLSAGNPGGNTGSSSNMMVNMTTTIKTEDDAGNGGIKRKREDDYDLV